MQSARRDVQRAEKRRSGGEAERGSKFFTSVIYIMSSLK